MHSEFHAHLRVALVRAIAARLWPVLLVGALVGAVGGWAAGTTVQDNRSATASVLLNPLEGNPFYPSARGEQLVNLATEAQVLGSNRVASSVIDRTGAQITPQEMLEGVSTSVPANTQIVEISYDYSEPEVAKARAQTFAEAFLDFRRQRAVSYVDDQTKSIQTEIDKLSEQLRLLTIDMNVANLGIADKNIVMSQIESNSSQVAQLGAQKSALSTTPLDPGQIITPASIQRAGPFGTQEILTAAGLALGLAAVLAVFFFLSRGRGRIGSTSEVKSYNLDVVAVVPMRSWTAEPSFVGPPIHDSSSSGFLQLRSRFIPLLPESRPDSLLIASSSEEVACPASIVPLALSLAAAGLHTVVVDTTGEIEMPGTERGNRPGLSQLLQGAVPLEKALVRINPHLQAVGTGRSRGNSSEVAGNPRFMDLLSDLDKNADVVLIAARSMTASETQLLARYIQSVLIEVELGRTRHEYLHTEVDICAGLPVNLLGALVLHHSRREASTSRPDTSKHSKNFEPEENHRTGSPAYGA